MAGILASIGTTKSFGPIGRCSMDDSDNFCSSFDLDFDLRPASLRHSRNAFVDESLAIFFSSASLRAVKSGIDRMVTGFFVSMMVGMVI